MFFSWVFMRTKYTWSQLAVRSQLYASVDWISTNASRQGILICVGGLGMLVASDQLTDKDYKAANKVKGDLFMLAGATLYGFS